MSVEISFHGAAGGVTGSCHMLRAGGLNIVVDCGMFQGPYPMEEKNHEPMGFDPREVDYLLLTHGHLDHCGRIPVLVKQGFKGKIITTAPTFDIAKTVFMDSARIQEEDYARWKRIRERRGQSPPKEPLYTTEDAIDALRLFDDFSFYKEPFKLNSNVSVTFRDAGHIFGSAFLEIDVKGFGRIVFSGDLGNVDKPIIKDPQTPSGPADIAVVESTYADRDHKQMTPSVEELYDAVRKTIKRGGNVLIPSFSIERAQEILYYLRELYDAEPSLRFQVFLDSPMAISVAKIMRAHPEFYDKETMELFADERDPFSFPGVEFTRTPDESRTINSIKQGAVIIAGSGMMTGGRIKHHMKHNIWRRECSLVVIGYQARGTLGRAIVDGEKEIKIYGRDFKVRSEIHTIGGFSAHADKAMLHRWLKAFGSIENLFMVHGEPDVLETFRKEFASADVARTIHIPAVNQKFML